jgi:hypothetical protein
MNKYKDITNDWNYDASCMLTSLLVLDLLDFLVAHSVHTIHTYNIKVLTIPAINEKLFHTMCVTYQLLTLEKNAQSADECYLYSTTKFSQHLFNTGHIKGIL